MSFATDLKKGNNVEEKFCEILRNDYLMSQVFRCEGEYKPFDIISANKLGKITTFEVKCDYKNQFTGNIAFELEFKNKASGVISTQADFIVYYLNNEHKFYSIKTKTFRRLLWQWENDRTYKIVNGGDSDNSSLLLLPVEEFKKLFSTLDISEKD